MKLAPLEKELRRYKGKVIHKIVHTGQHYDYKLSRIFFKDLELPKPDIYLGVGSAPHAEQTARIMERFEEVVFKERPDLVLVFGDVNSTLACSLVCSKIHHGKCTIPVAHVEAGLRSSDRTMPEEINRIVTDNLSKYLFVTEKAGVDNLVKEGISKDKIFLVGDSMIDSLKMFRKKFRSPGIIKKYKVTPLRFALATIHRPVNVDNKKNLLMVISILKKTLALAGNAETEFKILFPIHPRTKKMIRKFGLSKEFGKIKNIILSDPIGYTDFIGLLMQSKFVITDSGGIQEEATFLKIPCLTLRDSFERPETISIGSNTLCGLDEKLILRKVKEIISGKYKTFKIPKLMDGKASKRIRKIILAG
jgi:UDP-N-acetylglucosamine 2-epimerase (non-hydrolysing)